MTRSSEGSVLILVPVLVLVLFMLGAISVDSAVEYLGHRQLEDFTASAADQAAAAALDKHAFYLGGGAVSVTRSDAVAIVRQVELAQHGGGLKITDTKVSVSADDRTITVSASGIVRTVFGPATRGRRLVRVHAQSSAVVAGVARRA